MGNILGYLCRPHILKNSGVGLIFYLGSGVISLLHILFITPETQWIDISINLFLWLSFGVHLAFALWPLLYHERYKKSFMGILDAQQVSKVLDDGRTQKISPMDLEPGDIIILSEGDTVPRDGEIIEGQSFIDESIYNPDSSQVLKFSGKDHNSVLKGSKVAQGIIKVRIKRALGNSAIDKMLDLLEGKIEGVEGGKNSVTRFVFLYIFGLFYIGLLGVSNFNNNQNIQFILGLGGVLFPIYFWQFSSLAKQLHFRQLFEKRFLVSKDYDINKVSKLDIVLFDKTGTITEGQRAAISFIPIHGVNISELIHAAAMSSYFDTTFEGRSILKLAKEQYNWTAPGDILEFENIEFSSTTRMSGSKTSANTYIKGADQIIIDCIRKENSMATYLPPSDYGFTIQKISEMGGTSLGVVHNQKLLGIIFLTDQVKPDLREKFEQLQGMEIKTYMITGDSEKTARAIAFKAGIDQVIPKASPTDKLAYIFKWQEMKKIVAMCGDGANDAGALSQADVSLAMSLGAESSKESSQILDLESNPGKIVDLILGARETVCLEKAIRNFSIFFFVSLGVILVPSGLMEMGFYGHWITLNYIEGAVITGLGLNLVVSIFLFFYCWKIFPSGHFKLPIKYAWAMAPLGALFPPLVIKGIDLIIGGFFGAGL